MRGGGHLSPEGGAFNPAEVLAPVQGGVKPGEIRVAAPDTFSHDPDLHVRPLPPFAVDQGAPRVALEGGREGGGGDCLL